MFWLLFESSDPRETPGVYYDQNSEFVTRSGVHQRGNAKLYAVPDSYIRFLCEPEKQGASFLKYIIKRYFRLSMDERVSW